MAASKTEFRRNGPPGMFVEGPNQIYKMDAATFHKLKAMVEENNRIIQELRVEREVKARILQELCVDRFCLAFLKPKGNKSSEM